MRPGRADDVVDCRRDAGLGGSPALVAVKGVLGGLGALRVKGALRTTRPGIACGFLALFAAGCGAPGGAEVAFVTAGGGPSRGRVLKTAGGAGRAEMALLRAALRLAAASGRNRSVVDADAHFSRRRAAYYRVRLTDRGAALGEHWRLDPRWATAELPGGAVLAWEGDLRAAVETIAIVLPPRGPTPRRP